jgi:hypothetical protein
VGGGHVGITVCEKSSTEAAVVAKRQEVVELRQGVLAVADITETAWVSRSGLFLK